MALPIISTKLHIPQPPKTLVNRPKLISRLQADIRGKLILVSAPAGFGKTTLLAEWADHCGQDCRFCWVHLDESDNQPARFLSYVIAALQTQHETLGEAALAGLHATPPAPPDAVLASLVNEIDALDLELIVVLDDYHLVDTPAIHQAVGFLIDHIPPLFSLVLSTRSDPALPVHKWRARGQVIEIRAKDLRFGEQEIRRFFIETLSAPLSPSDIAALDRRIEGWVAGYQMVALSLKDRQDAREFIASFSGSHRYIMDFLTEEIFNQQPAHIQEFLLYTSVLERLSGPLCDAVLGSVPPEQVGQRAGQPAQRILEHLEHANLFLLPLDEERHWFSYHHLFANMLRQRLRSTEPEAIPRLLRRASGWHAANGTSEEAFQYALAAGDDQAAARLVEAHALDKLKRGSLAILLDQLNRLPEEIVLGSSWLSVYMSWVLLLTGNFEYLDRFLLAAEEAEGLSQDTEDLRGHVMAIRAYAAAMVGGAEQALELAKQALDLLPQDNFTVRSVVTFVLGGINVIQGDIPGAIEAMKQAGESGMRAGNIHLAVSALSSAGDLVLGQGKLDEAELIYAQALKSGTGRSGRPLPIAASVYAGLAEIYLGRNDLQKAHHFAQTGLDLAGQWGNPENLAGCYLALAKVSWREGEMARARDALDGAKRLAATHTLSPSTAERIEACEELILAGLLPPIGQESLIDPLTERELEVLGLMAMGRSNAEIAAELIVALGTVKAHSSSIYRKLDVRGRTEAVLKARELGLL